MSVLSPKRVIQFVAASLLALPLLATHPSPRLGPRMAFDEGSGVGVLFGGRAIDDPATGLVHASDQTWLFVRTSWVQQFPATNPSARSNHAMVYDSARDRVIMFGGRKEAEVVRQRFALLDDTWAWKNGEWQDLAPATKPPARLFPGLAYDRDRDRVILFGGFNYSADGKFTIEARFDTWEFDGENWTRVNESGPEVSKPLLVFDAARHETIMLGFGTTFLDTLMYRWDSATSSWKSITAATLPTCVNEGQFVYQTQNQRPVVMGGICTGTEIFDETFEWDGTTWTKLPVTGITRIVGAAATYDTAASQLIRYGGNPAFQTTPESVTTLYKNLEWRGVTRSGAPGPRSMPLFRRDPERDTVWMFGGLSEYSFGATIDYLSDLWGYRDGQWRLLAQDASTPLGCVTPIGALDTTRDKLVVVCSGSTVYEWDGEAWKTFTNLSTSPPDRRFASFAYDETLKKFVLFGGYDSVGNYRQDTWTWDGAAWTEVKPKTKPEHRAQGVMWYDPLAKKTILYSGAGRRSIEDHATRFSDMWSFNGTEWTKLSVTVTPGIRFAPQVAIDPSSGKLLLFGGLRATIDEDDRVTQFYDNDMWVWDGSTSAWTEIQLGNAPSPRQNGAFDYDVASGKFVLFGGFAGNFYFSDRWLWDGQNWTAVPDAPVSYRRRSTRP
ncbi:MAG TPA: kelch repeat-containing protein [Thermoanaerobaculia bacterium]|jgi:hypothetical protein|nr:kelch repeat-containing protein [Thermoanaerobaculia bacterium]